MASAPADLNLIGFLSSNFGLGVVARRWARALARAGLRVRAVDLPDPRGRRLPGATELGTADAGEAALSLIVANPPEVEHFERKGLLTLRGRQNVLIPFWELARLPASWLPVLRAMDRVVASSRFIEATLRQDLPAAAVAWAPPPLPELAGRARDRARFGWPAGATVFASALEVASDTARKNPWAVIEAFQAAFPGRADVHLAVKLNNAGQQPDAGTAVERLRARLSAEPRASLLEKTWSDEVMLGWLASADAYVSLHRAEGLGLPLLEAMALGRPVVATAWSGNMDFTSEANACLVGQRQVGVVTETQAAYASVPGATWAEPDVGEAARWLRRLADEPGLRAALGARAAADVRAFGERAGLAALAPVLASLGLSRAARTC